MVLLPPVAISGPDFGEGRPDSVEPCGTTVHLAEHGEADDLRFRHGGRNGYAVLDAVIVYCSHGPKPPESRKPTAGNAKGFGAVVVGCAGAVAVADCSATIH